MKPEPVTLALAHSAIEALRLFGDGGFRHLPVRGIVVSDDVRAHAWLNEKIACCEILHRSLTSGG